MGIVEELLKGIPIPRMVKVRQNFVAPEIADVPAAVQQAIQEAGVLSHIQKGDSVAIAVGSRGVADIPILAREVVNAVRRRKGS